MKPISLILAVIALFALLHAGTALGGPGSTFVVTSTADNSDGFCEAHCTLREALTAANGSPSSKIMFSAIGFGAHKVINLDATLPTITASVEILGPPQGVTIRRNSVAIIVSFSSQPLTRRSNCMA